MIAYIKKNKPAKPMPAAFLDRDGTIIHDRAGSYLTCAAKMRLYKAAPEALKIIQDLGYRLIIITNQSAVSRGYMTLAKSIAINRKLAEILRRKGVLIEGIYFCPHAPGQNCRCRKPRPGLVKEALKRHKIDLKKSVMIGDKESDAMLAKNLGIKFIMLMTGQGKSQRKCNSRNFLTSRNLKEAARKLAVQTLP